MRPRLSHAKWAAEQVSAETKKPDTGDPLHTREPVTVASFRTWRGWRECVARDRCLTYLILASRTYSSLSQRNRATIGEVPGSEYRDKTGSTHSGWVEECAV